MNSPSDSSLNLTLTDLPVPSSQVEDRLALIARILDAVGRELTEPCLVHDTEMGPVVVSLDAARVIGRSVRADYPGPTCADLSLSGRHCRVEPTPDGMLLEDLQSTNGTWIDTRRVETRLLRAGDLVRIGRQRFVYFDPQ
ncbi:FHA domain-containing protein [Actomonas aquatica]|uniref:FHA domain-containing protein n=1 Tax=Actomonas aquatica TaxID=2866162 RepID=A0ABZ1C4Y8_9BACT|nr:FHA domain-containing protein [Opitutus sp. WL0086]WRQ86659.1 FHA domain-containing protein [Opitutus sp. WL0086]